MFDRIVVVSRPRSRRRAAFLGISIAVHTAAALSLAVADTWQLERLSPPERQVTVVVEPSLPEPPLEEPAPSRRRATPPRRSGPPSTRVARQRPLRPSSDADETALDVEVMIPGADAAVATGGAGGTGGDGSGGGGIGAGRMALDLIPVAPPPAPEPRAVSARLLEGRRIAGNAHIPPPPSVQASMLRAERKTLRAEIEMCLASTGRIDSLALVRSSGYDAYDAQLLHEMGRWRYRPYRLGGDPIPVCSVVTFVYRIE